MDAQGHLVVESRMGAEIRFRVKFRNLCKKDTMCGFIYSVKERCVYSAV